MQNVEETQEIPDTDPQSPLVAFHAPESKAKAFPCASMLAQYPETAHPTASRPFAPSKVTGADHTSPFQLIT